MKSKVIKKKPLAVIEYFTDKKVPLNLLISNMYYKKMLIYKKKIQTSENIIQSSRKLRQD